MNKRLAILSGALCVGYVAIRFWGLTTSCLWFDEIFSVHAAEHSWNSILTFVSLDLIHPPLFYVLLKLWIGIGGEGLFWLRLFPVVFSVIAIFPFISLCRELKLGKWTQILALFLFAVNGSLIKYAQEVRMYSLLLCISLFSTWLFLRYFNKGNGFVPLLLINVLFVYTHYFGWLVVVSEITAILIFQRTKWRGSLAMFAITLVSFIPWVAAIVHAAQTGSGLGQNIGWMMRPGILAIIQFKLNLIEPFYYAASSVESLSVYRVSVPLLLIFTVAIFLYLLKWNLRSKDENMTACLLFIFVIVPVVMAFAASWLLPYSIWGTRHLIVVFAPVAVFLAGAILKISSAAVRTAAVTLIILFSGYAFALQAMRDTPHYSWCAWEPLAAQAKELQNANIYVFEDLVAYHIWFAGRTSGRCFKVRDITGITEDNAYFLPRGFDDVRAVDITDINESSLWIAYRAQTAAPNEPPLRNFIVNGYHISDQRTMSADGENAIFVLIER